MLKCFRGEKNHTLLLFSPSSTPALGVKAVGSYVSGSRNEKEGRQAGI